MVNSTTTEKKEPEVYYSSHGSSEETLANHTHETLPNKPPSAIVYESSLSNLSLDEEANDRSGDEVEKSLQAWLCVLGSWCFLVASFGFGQALGTLQSYLSLHQLKSYNIGDIGWISSLYLFVSLVFNIQIGPLMDRYGPRVLAPIGAGLTVAMLLLIAECTKFWHFILCLSIVGGLGTAVSSIVGISIIGKLFVKRRGLAMGVALTGSSSGAIIFPSMLRSILPSLGWQWSMRILALVVGGMMIPAMICFIPFNRLVVKRTPNEKQAPEPVKLNFSAFKKPAFTFIALALFLDEFVNYAVSCLLPIISQGAGFSPEDGYTLISVMGAASCIGRVLPGFIGDRVGHYNVVITMIVFLIAMMATMLIPFVGVKSVLYAFSALWGFGSGAVLAMTPVCMGKTCDAKDYGRYWGTMNFLNSFSLLISIPSSGIMLDNMGPQALAGFLVSVLVAAGACYFVSRSLLVPNWLRLKVKI